MGLALFYFQMEDFSSAAIIGLGVGALSLIFKKTSFHAETLLCIGKEKEMLEDGSNVWPSIIGRGEFLGSLGGGTSGLFKGINNQMEAFIASDRMIGETLLSPAFDANIA